MTLIDKETLSDLYIKQNKTQSEIGRIYKCDRKNISYYLNKYDIKKSKQQTYSKHYKQKPTTQEILSLVDEGYLLKDIALKYNLSRGTITKILKESNINMRNHKGQTKKQSQFMKTDNPFKDESIKRKAIRRSHQSKDTNFKIKRDVFDEDMAFKDYAKKARAIAYKHYSKEIRKGFCIDHMYSVHDGYVNKVPLNIISKPDNLRIVSERDNAKKGKRSIISLEDLYKI